MIHSTFFILGARETKGENIFILLPPTSFTASHPNTLPNSTPHLTHIIYGNKGRDKKRSSCFHNFFPSRLMRKNFCSAITSALSLPSYNTGWFGYASDMSSTLPPVRESCFRKTSQGVSFHLSSTIIGGS